MTRLLAIALLALAACSAPSAAIVSTSPTLVTATSQTPAPPPTPTVTPSPSVAGTLAIGAALTNAYVRITVSAAKTQPQGHHDQPLYGVMVQTCNIGADPISAGPHPWSIATADGSTFATASVSWANDPIPQYPDGQIVVAGQCVKGWLLFEVPAGTMITSVRYGVELATGGVLTGVWQV
jgi:hypothetical protein